MRIVPCSIRGKLKWRLDARINGKGKRPTFDTKGAAEKALADARKQRAAFGKAFDVLSAREKSGVMATIQKIRLAGFTLETVLQAAQTSGNVPTGLMTLQEAKTGCLQEAKDRKCRERHIDNLEWYLGRFVKGRESYDIGAILLPQLKDWFKGSKDSPRSINGYISLLSIMFDYAWRHGAIPENPVKRLKRPKIDRGTPATLNHSQQIKALLFARRRKPKFLGWLVLTLKLGMRPEAEADAINWKMIDLKRRRIVLDRSKVRHVPHRIIDLRFCPGAFEWLCVAKKLKCPLPLPFETRRRAVRALRDYLGLDRWPQDILRHTAASNLLAIHQDAGKVAKFIGTSVSVLLRDYQALIFKEDAEKISRIVPKLRHYKIRKEL